MHTRLVYEETRLVWMAVYIYGTVWNIICMYTSFGWSREGRRVVLFFSFPFLLDFPFSKVFFLFGDGGERTNRERKKERDIHIGDILDG